MPKLIIDDLEIEVPAGTRVIDAAERLGIMIPRFCYHEGLGAVGACRMCAVKYLQGPFKGVQMSCMVDAQDGMVVSTTDEEAVQFRKYVIEWLMLNHPHDCPVCDEGGHCLLQDETVSGGHGIRRYLGKKRTYRDQYLGVLVQHEMNRCIHCYRCVRFYREFAGYRDLGVMQIGNRVYFGRFSDGPLQSPFSGNLIDLCPTGVYTDKPARYKARRWDLERSPSVCIHCSLGCNTIACARYRAVIRQEGRFSEAVNGYFLCDLGRFGYGYANHTERPRRAKSGGIEAAFDVGVRTAAEKLAAISHEAGLGAVACLGSARSSMEAQGMLKHLCRSQGWPEPCFFLDTAGRAALQTAVSRLDQKLAVSLREIEDADFVLVVGADPVNEAPMLVLAIRQACRREAAVAVIDPRPVSLPLEFEHLAVTRGDLDGSLKQLIKRSITREAAEKAGPAALVFYDSLQDRYPFDPETRDKLSALATQLGASKKPVIVCGTGIVDGATPAVAADFVLLLRALKESAGLFYVLPGANGFGAAILDSQAGRSFAEIVEAIENGVVKALLVVESDPLRRFADRERLQRALSRLELLVVLDYLPSETARRADILLPTTTLYETASSFINQEGRLQSVDALHSGGFPVSQVSAGSHPPRTFGAAVAGDKPQAAWRTLAEFARLLAQRQDGGGGKLSPWPIIISENPKLAYLQLNEAGYPHGNVRVIPLESRVPAFDSVLQPRGKARREDALELLLTDWTFGTEELASYSDTLRRVEPEPHLSMHAADAAVLGLGDGDRVALQLDGGELEVTLHVSEKMARQTLILPRHHRLSWQKLQTFPVLVPRERIRRIRP